MDFGADGRAGLWAGLLAALERSMPDAARLEFLFAMTLSEESV